MADPPVPDAGATESLVEAVRSAAVNYRQRSLSTPGGNLTVQRPYYDVLVARVGKEAADAGLDSEALRAGFDGWEILG